MTVAIGSDHAGKNLRLFVKTLLEKQGIEVEDKGTHEDGSVDYPTYAARVAQAITSGECDSGILICGSGLGMSIAANRFAGIRAALCRDTTSAYYARLHNDANILVFGERFSGHAVVEDILKTWWSTSFEGERHLRRIEQIEINAQQ